MIYKNSTKKDKEKVALDLTKCSNLAIQLAVMFPPLNTCLLEIYKKGLNLQKLNTKWGYY